MHVAKIVRRHGEREYTSHLVRRSIREGRRVRHETIANVTGLPAAAIQALTLALKGVALVPADQAFEIVAVRKHGHVEAVLAAARRLGLARLLDREPCRERLDELANRTRNTFRVSGSEASFPKLSTPTELQARALELIDERVPQLT